MEPQHFQQQERHLEHLIDMRARSLDALAWGFHKLSINQGLLDQGKIALNKASGVFPDGTPFSLGDNDLLPLPFAPGENCQGSVVCLSTLMDIPGNTLIDLTQSNRSSRFRVVDAEIPDRNHGVVAEGTPLTAAIQLGQLQTRLNVRSAISEAETLLPVAYIKERTRDGRLLLDDKFLPPMIDFRTTGWLENATTELLGLIVQRLEAVYRPDVPLSVGGLSELLELMLLQSLSEYNLTLSHLLSLPQVHPERLFHTLLGLLGRLSTIPGGEKAWGRQDLVYSHIEPHNGYLTLFAALRRALSLVIEAPAVALPFVERGDNIYLYQNDPQLRLEKLIFTVTTKLPADTVRTYFPAQTKLGPVEKIVQLIDLQLPGARLMPMASPPRHIPYYPNSVYFEVDNSDAMYQEMMSGSAVALSIVGDFPELRFEAWGLRQGRVG
ncbi:type VI secretion system protein ImpJ [Enterobacillus tribolii]|uniref:Type VI secretion system protein ImpJ n=2 Tax=Enterobacillus tribolii TaxID=1487935 RepID=A0A370QEM3_9GAMM|nr:type VI secretion system protein ImpJ [Enterobacillus tribolii]